MEKYIVQGNKKLTGEISIHGAKNAAVAIIPATLLANGPCVLENVPPVTDVGVLCDILSILGAKVSWRDKFTLELDTANVNRAVVPADLSNKLRASYYLMGAMLGRFGHATVGMPGGCKIGPRPIDQHLKGFHALNCETEIKSGDVVMTSSGLSGGNVYFDIVSVGATVNVMLAAAGAEGTTIIENAAREPEIIDLANFLNQIGVSVKGAGTGTIRIQGAQDRGSSAHSIIPDRIEAGTFMIAAAATGGNILVKDVIPRHLEPVTAKLRETGNQVEEGDDWVQVQGSSRGTAVDLKTLPYPGFPTDLQQPMSTYLARCTGTSVVTENIFENRFRYVEELKRMGANIKVEGRVAVIEGVDSLAGALVTAHDLRASSALVVAALSASGKSEVQGIEFLNRGYYDFAGKLKKLGARIEQD